MRELCVDLFCGLGGWAEGFLAEGYDVIGFDIERHDYGTGGYLGQLVLQDVRTLHGSQFKDAACFVGSSPCTDYSYMAMPWSRAKRIALALRGLGEFPNGYKGPRTVEQLNELFFTQFRLQREASEAAGRWIPMVVENVKGAQVWVGPAKWRYGSFYLWGDVPALMPSARVLKVPGFNFHEHEKTGQPGRSFQSCAVAGVKSPGMDWSKYGKPGYKAEAFNTTSEQRMRATKNTGGSWFNVAHNTESGKGQNPDGRAVKTVGHVNKRDGYTHTRHLTNQRESDAVKRPNGSPDEGIKHHGSGPIWFNTGQSLLSSKSDSRKAASAHIAKIPFPLARHIARCFKTHIHAQELQNA